MSFSMSEVKKHKKPDDLWIVIHNDVYDVTKYLDEHPGGVEVLMEVAGTDGTQPFDDVHHSDDAKEIMRKFKIGSLPVGERVVQNTHPWWLWLLLAAGVTATGVFLYKKNS